MAVLYRPPGLAGVPWGYDSREVWMECIRRALGTFRAFNPAEELLLVDAHGVLDEAEARLLGCQLLSSSAVTSWSQSNWVKVLALGISPFDETCLFDLDFHFCASMAGVFDAVTEPIGALSYPHHHNPERVINTGLTVCRDRGILAQWAKHRAPDVDRDDDELPLRRAVLSGDIKATLLPDTWGRFRDNWLTAGWHVDCVRSSARAYHWQGLKPQMAADTQIAGLLAGYPANAGRMDQWPA
jgi:hypothetical protein